MLKNIIIDANQNTSFLRFYAGREPKSFPSIDPSVCEAPDGVFFYS